MFLSSHGTVPRRPRSRTAGVRSDMAFGISSKARVSPIAIDFGADAIKMLQIVPDGPGQVVVAGSAVVPHDARTNATERLDFIEEAIKGLMRNLPIRGRRAICAIPGFQTLIHNFMIPRTDPEDIDALIDLQLRDRLGVEPGRMILKNFHAVDHHRRGAARSDVICLAAKREQVMQYLGLAGRCRLEVVGMHVEPLCVTRCFEDLLDDVSGAVAFVDLGAATTKVIIAHGQKLLMVKTIHAGGDHWNQLHAQQAKLEFDEARRMRVAQINGDDAGGGVATATADESGTESDTHDEVLLTLIDELRLVLRHHRGRHPSLSLDKLVLLGGEANDDKLRGRLSHALGVPCELGDAFAGMDRDVEAGAAIGVDPTDPAPNWAVAVGLCRSEANL
ncbi:MAG: pilus assembly protein PilM [Planctomycetota bacterium]